VGFQLLVRDGGYMAFDAAELLSEQTIPDNDGSAAGRWSNGPEGTD